MRGAFGRTGRYRRVVGATVLVGGALVAFALPATAEPGLSTVHFLPHDVGLPVAGTEPFAAVSCPTLANCSAAGPGYQGVAGSTASVSSSTSGVWSAAHGLTLPANQDTKKGVKSSSLNGIACWQATSCVVVGGYVIAENLAGASDSAITPMAAVESGGVWSTAVAIPLPATDYVAGELSSVSCDNAGNCTAVGWYVDVSNSFIVTYHAFVTSETAGSGTWSTPTLLADPGGAVSLLVATSVSCANSLNCTASEFVGRGSSNNASYQSALVTETAGVWGTPVAVGKAGTRRVEITSLSCPALNECVAVGYSAATSADLYNNAHTLPAIAVETGALWGTPKDIPLPLLSPLPTGGGELLGVSCVVVNSCVAVGEGSYGKTAQFAAPLAVTLTGATPSSSNEYTSTLHVGTSVATVAAYNAVSCFSATTCLGLGNASTGTVADNNEVDSFSNFVTLVETPRVSRAPTSLKIASTSSRTIVAYQPPTNDGGARVTLFTVTAKSPGLANKSCSSKALSCSFTGAVSGHTYTVTAVAKNAAGSSNPSPPVTFRAA